MSSLAYINDMDVQGWEPTCDGPADIGLASLKLPSSLNLAPASASKTESPILPSRRQAPPTRAQAAAYLITPNYTPVSRADLNSQTLSTSSPMTQQQPYPVATSARSASAAGRSGSRPRSSTERKIARKLAENVNYVPRPKNSFILFRTEFVAQQTAAYNATERDTKRNKTSNSPDHYEGDEESHQSLSKQASEVWNRMTEEEKRPWAERAKLEKAAHEAKYPQYRYKPVRQNLTRKTSSAPEPASRCTSSPRHRTRSSSPLGTSSEASASTLVDTEDSKEGDKPASVFDESANDFSSVPSRPSTSGAEICTPSPLRMLSLPTALPSSSSLAVAITSPTFKSATTQETSTNGLLLPTVPRVPSLNLSHRVPSRATGLPPIPRSPSAPVFDKRMVGQFSQQSQSQSQAQHSAAVTGIQNSYPSTIFARPSSCPSTPKMPVFSFSESEIVASPLSSRSDLTLPTPPAAEADYFLDFLQQDDVLPPPAGSAFPFADQQMFTNVEDNCQKTNSDRAHLGQHNEMDEMDIDMHKLLNLSPVPEVPETTSTPVDTATTVHPPFEVVAALWAQDQQQQQPQQTNGLTTDLLCKPDLHVNTSTLVQRQTQCYASSATTPTSVDAIYSSFVSSPTKPSPVSFEQDLGLDMYALAVSGNDNCTNTSMSDFFTSCAENLGEDLFHVDMNLDLDPTFSSFGAGCAARSTFGLSSPLNMSSDADELFRYDREHGLYGFTGGFGTTAGSADGDGYGYGYGF